MSAITMRTTFAGPKIFGRPIILPTRYPLWARLPLVVGVPCGLGAALIGAQHRPKTRRPSYHVPARPQFSFAHHHRAHRRLRTSTRRSRSTQNRRSAILGRLRNLPSQSSRPRQGQVQPGTVVLPAPTLHEQRCFSAEAHSLSSIRGCASVQGAARHSEVEIFGHWRIRAAATSSVAGSDPLISDLLA
jgi:hypothetical protein